MMYYTMTVTRGMWLYAKAHLRASPVAVLATPVTLTEEHCGSLPKYYILCTAAKDMDKTGLVRNVDCKKIFNLPSNHSPFFSMPERLAAVLEEVYAE